MGKYEEALERARQGLPMDEVFLELKGSEDERIRKELIQYLKDYPTNLPNGQYTRADFFAYLEKLKEQKPIFKKGDKVIWDGEEFNILDVDKDTYNVGGYIVPFSREGELHPIGQKPAEWSEEYREEDLRMRFAFYTYKGEDSALYLSNVFVEETSRNKGFGAKILAAAEKVAETLGAIQIRLKVKQNSPANAWYRKHGYGYIAFEDGYDWLEKTLEYMKPKQEWSEEEEKIRKELYEYFRQLQLMSDREFSPSLSIDEILSWLKAIHSDSYKNCNSRWKPSDEHPEGGYSEKPNDLLSEAAKDSWTEYEYRESPRGLYSTCYVDGFKAGAEWMAGQFHKIEGDLIDWYSTSDGKEYCCGIKTDEAFEIPEGFYIQKKQQPGESLKENEDGNK